MEKNTSSLQNKTNVSLWWGKKRTKGGKKGGIFLSKEEQVSFQISTIAAALKWDVSERGTLWCTVAAGYPEEAFLQSVLSLS